ncbi:MAG: NUDIX domain-containing protein [Chloroflexota bacterium]
MFEQLANLPLDQRWRQQRYPAPIVVAVVKRPFNNSYLLIQRNSEPYKDKLALVSGKWEFGETLATAIEREAAEETGLTAQFTALHNLLNERIAPETATEESCHFLLFVCELIVAAGEASTQAEGTVGWFTPSEIETLQTQEAIVPTDYRLLQMARRSAQHKSLPYFEANMLRKSDQSIEMISFQPIEQA